LSIYTPADLALLPHHLQVCELLLDVVGRSCTRACPSQSLAITANLDSRTRNEEPLVDARINGGRGLVGASGDLAELRGVNTVRRVGVCGIRKADSARLGLASDQALPSIAALVNDLLGILLVLALATECELVLGLSIWDLVDAEPLVGGAQKTRQMTLDILDVVELGGKRVIDVDDNDLPVSFLLIEKSHDTKDLDLFDLASVSNNLADLAHVERVVVAFGLGLGMNDVGVFPGLQTNELFAIQRSDGELTLGKAP
jgi:hypothetical protein